MVRLFLKCYYCDYVPANHAEIFSVQDAELWWRSEPGMYQGHDAQERNVEVFHGSVH